MFGWLDFLWCGGCVVLVGFVSFLVNGGGGEPSKRFHSGKSSVRCRPKKKTFYCFANYSPSTSS